MHNRILFVCLLLALFFSETMSQVKSNEDWAIVPIYDYAEPFSGGFAVVGWNTKSGIRYGFINEKGETLISDLLEAKRFSCGLAPVKTDMGWGYINTLGKFISVPTYDYASVFYGDMALVGISTNNQRKWIIDVNEKLIAYDYSEKFAPLKKMIIEHQSVNTFSRFKLHYQNGKYGFLYAPLTLTYWLNSNIKPWDEYMNSKLLKMEKLEKFEDYLKKHIEADINQWQQKGEFEPTTKWKERVNETTRKLKIDDLTHKYRKEYEEKLHIYNKAYVGLVEDYKKEYEKCRDEYYEFITRLKFEDFYKASFVLMQYDSDNQTFMIKSHKQGDILMSVPLEEAPSFKQNWNTIKQTITPTFVPSGDDVVLTSVTVTNGNKKYVYDSHTQAKYAVTDINYNFNPVEISIPDVADVNYTFDPVEAIQSTVVQTSPIVKGLEANNATIERKSIDATKQSDVDVNIPQSTKLKNSNTFVVIIANEDYQRVSDVTFAANDGKLFAEYCTKALGLPQNHVMLYTDATLGNMLGAVNHMKEIGEAYSGKANIIFYYAGHGIPDETSKDAYLLPVDGDGSSVRTCYKQSELFAELASVKANSVIVFMDACFSGAQRGDGMLMAARGVAIKAKRSNPLGNMVVFSAAQGDETAYPYKEQRHGMFTYYLLKKLQETKGEATLGEISDYVTSEVRKQSIVINGKMQTPTLTSSSAIGDSWRNWKLK